MASLVSMVPQKAVLADTGEEVYVDQVMLNTLLTVKAGETIPMDGVVVDGNCEADEKLLTGESFPVAKQKDSTVLASSINLNGMASHRLPSHFFLITTASVTSFIYIYWFFQVT